jgi:long-subunit fatty acid transport protein
MNKKIILALCVASPFAVMAQSALDAFQFSQPDLKGTARFMSMGGAFGALGGDMSVLDQNPAGIGVYRSSDASFTLNLDCQSSTAKSQGASVTDNQTKFLLNNIGYIATFKTDNAILPNVNIGFSYNKSASFNRRYSGVVPQLKNSLSNYIAGIANSEGITTGDLTTTSSYDPYNPTDGGYVAPWLAILGYDSRLISPRSEGESSWVGQWNSSTSGNGSLNVQEKGAMDEYNISLGGNISNLVYWGMTVGIIDFSYSQLSGWSESLTNASVANDNDVIGNTTANWNLANEYNVSGTGFNYKLGVIIKPIQEFRIGLAFHTPTYYSMDESYYASIKYQYDNGVRPGAAETNNGYYGEYSYKFHTPWKAIFSAAGVIGSKFIISADYEWTKYQGMKFSDKYNDGWGGVYDTYYYTNSDIKDYYKAGNTIRIGAEYRVSPSFSVRAGYSFVSSPVKDEAKNGEVEIYPAGTRAAYCFDDDTNYICAGLGYRHSGFYADLAYVYKHRTSMYHAYPTDSETPSMPSPTAKITSINNQVVLTLGYRF